MGKSTELYRIWCLQGSNRSQCGWRACVWWGDGSGWIQTVKGLQGAVKGFEAKERLNRYTSSLTENVSDRRHRVQ